MSRRLDGKVAIVTGASRGIGRAVALAFARAGAGVVVAAKTETPHPLLPGTIHTVAEEIRALGGRALPLRVDVRRDEDVEAMAARALDAFGRIDVLVCNAGALWWKPLLDTPMKRYDLVHEVNSRAAFACTRAVLPAMLAGDGGHVVVYSPPIDVAAAPGRIAYCISKFGMTLLAHGLAEELRGRPFSVNALWPATAIESAATVNFGLGVPELWRKADIVADATVELVSRPPGEQSGLALLDEDVLRAAGVTDFARYRCVPDSEPPRLGLADLPMVG